MSYYTESTSDISFTPLTVEEEKALFVSYYGGDLSARDELIQRHLKLVAKLSLQHAKRSLPDDEAISAGNFGLIQALESKCFDPNRGVRFASYVRSYVRGQVLAAIRERACGDAGGAAPKSIIPDDAAITGHAADGLHDNSLVCFNYQSGTSGRFGDAETEICIATVDPAYPEQQLNEVRRQKIEAALAQLKPHEALAIRRVELEGQSLADVARERGVSRQAVQVAHARGWRKLREILAKDKNELV